MELKNYQKQVLEDLAAYLQTLYAEDTPPSSLEAAWQKYWQDKDFAVGAEGIPSYQDNLGDAPQVCMKVPTGGGKTLLACAAVQKIFSGRGWKPGSPRLVVWLVPSDAILTQTVRNLSNPEHPYHQRLAQDSHSRVVVYNKEQLLAAQGFSPDTVREQLTVCVLSFASLRINSRKKDVRKVYQENGNLIRFAESFGITAETLQESNLPADTPETSLISVLNHLRPVVVVDESHNAQSDLSVEMLNNLHPSFVLDLTATPKKGSNIIFYVDARELQKENMVKLPVIVYNRKQKRDVVGDALRLRGKLEAAAIEQEKQGGPYIRPIILFQAQPKVANNKSTYENLKKELVGMGIAEDQIAIKTSEIDDLAGKELMSRDCPIRFIITVNALKEGWDCSFAYVLASLANKNSAVDVEQILGRVLRQPYTRRYAAAELNMSYVLTCSADFHATLENIVKGLNNAGFSRKDFRTAEEAPMETAQPEPQAEQLGLGLEHQPSPQNTETPVTGNESIGDETEPETEQADDDFSDIRPHDSLLGESGASYETGLPQDQHVTDMLSQAASQAQEYQEQAEEVEQSGLATGELGNMQKQYKMQPEFVNEAEALRLPQFFSETPGLSLWGGSRQLLAPENLLVGFSLQDQDADISFELATGDVYKVNISEQGEAVPKYQRLNKLEGQRFREYLAQLADAERIKACAGNIAMTLSNRDDGTVDPDISAYVQRIIHNMSNDELEALATSLPFYASRIKEKIKSLKRSFAEKNFYMGIDAGRIVCEDSYQLPKVITPADATDAIPNSLYEAEKDDMNGFEHRLLDAIVSQPNVLWWHRIIERKGMCLNAFINHYPDFMVRTKSGKTLLIEAKGQQLANDDSRTKLKLGSKWQSLAGMGKYRYFMVFDQEGLTGDGAYTMEQFIGEILPNL